MNVEKRDLERVYQAMKTPVKLGFVLREENAAIDCCSVFRACGEWRMLYARHNAAVSDERKGYETWMARSADLLRWEPMGAVLPQSYAGWDALQADGGIALLDPAWDGSHAPERFRDRYWMSYFGNALPGYEPDPLQIGMASTVSLETARPWLRHPRPVMAHTDADAREFERKTLYKSFVIRDREKTLGAEFLMYYNAKGPAFSIEKIGVAVSDDLLRWRRLGSGPVVESGRPDTAWHIAGDPQIIRFEDLWVMHFFVACAVNGAPTAYDTFAVSRDLLHWTRWEGEPLVAPSLPLDQTFAHKPFLVFWNGRVHHFYCAVGQQGRGLALAVSA